MKEADVGLLCGEALGEGHTERGHQDPYDMVTMLILIGMNIQVSMRRLRSSLITTSGLSDILLQPPGGDLESEAASRFTAKQI